jgi:iron(III) transport system permease protein
MSVRRLWPAFALGAVLAYLVFVPVAFVLVSSFKIDGFPSDPGFTLANYVAVYSDPDLPQLVVNTLLFAAGSTALSLALGFVLAWLVERTDLPGRRAARALIVLPMATPPMLLGIAWAMLGSPRNGFFNYVLMGILGRETALFNIFSLPGMIFVEALAQVPTVFLILVPAFRAMDPSLEEAALTAGASPWTVLRRVVIPVLRPAILAAGAFGAIVGLVVFDVPGTIGMPARIFVLSSQIYYLAVSGASAVPRYGQISALAMSFVVVLLALGAIYQRLTREASRFVTVTGKAYRPRVQPLHGLRWPAVGFVAAYFFFAVAAPLGILLWISLMPYQAPISLAMLPRLTLANHGEFLTSPRLLLATTNSAIVAGMAATLVTLFSTILGWVIVRLRLPGRQALDLLAFLPIAIAGVLLGIALTYVYLTIQLVPIYGTVWILVVAYVTVYLAYGSRAAQTVMIQLHRDLEEAAATSGAGATRVLRRITLPLVLPGLAAIWLWVVAHVVRELSTALMLHKRQNTVITTLLWDYWSSGEPTEAAAVAVWLIVALAMLVGGWQFLGRRGALDRVP